ncbi:hypothetical protein AVEN_109906-1, partial [Araneus ventricosus]
FIDRWSVVLFRCAGGEEYPPNLNITPAGNSFENLPVVQCTPWYGVIYVTVLS